MKEVSFLNRLKELRQKNNLTLKQLGQKLNMLDSTLSQYETGKRNPKNEIWQKLADFYGVTVPYIKGLTYSKYDIFKILNDCFISKESMFNTVMRYLKYAKINPPQDIFSKKELKQYSPEVQKYWENNFEFIFASRGIKILLSMEKHSGYAIPVDERIIAVIDNRTLTITKTPISEAFSAITGTYPYSLLDFFSDYENILRFMPKSVVNKYISEAILELKTFKKTLKKLPDNPNNNI